MLGSPCWYPLAIQPIAIGANIRTVCHQGAIGCLRAFDVAITALVSTVSVTAASGITCAFRYCVRQSVTMLLGSQLWAFRTQRDCTAVITTNNSASTSMRLSFAD